MPLLIPLDKLRRDLEEKIRHNKLLDALQSLLLLLPEGSKKHRLVSTLITRFNSAKQERQRNTLSLGKYGRRVDKINADFLDFTAALIESDFDVAISVETGASPKTSISKQGSLLYRVPHVMPLEKSTLCTVRVAINKDAILEDIVFDEHVQMKTREVSDQMSTELVDPEGGIFEIKSLNPHTQLVRDSGYTEWIFNVKPLREGVHQLLVKVSIMEKVQGITALVPHDLSLMETITIVSENLAPSDFDDMPLKSSGEIFVFHSTSTADYFEVNDPIGGRLTRRWRILVTLLTSLILILAVTWLSMPEPTRSWYLARIKDDAATYQDYIDMHKDKTTAKEFVEKATFRKAVKTDQPKDYLTYLEEYKDNGQYQVASQQALKDLETKHLQGIRENPSLLEVRQFLADFPTSERLPELKKAVETRPELAPEVLPEVETGYVYAVQATQSPQRVRQFLIDFPESQKLADITKSVMENPALALEVQPELEDVYLKKMETKPTKAQVEEFLLNFPLPVRKERFEQILEKHPNWKIEFLPQMKEAEKKQKAENISRQKQIQRNSRTGMYAPTVYSIAAKNITQTSALLFGIVNPNGTNTQARLIIPNASKDKQPPIQNLDSGTSPVMLPQPVSMAGLSPGTTYSFCVGASNSVGETYGNWVLFTTLGTTPPGSDFTPSYADGYVTNITENSVTLNGVFAPNGQTSTNVWFEMPTNKHPQVQNIGRGKSLVAFSTIMTGLTSGTTYKFRAVASNSAGTTYGSWISFSTLKTGQALFSGFEMVLVSGGSYTMGSPSGEAGRLVDECQHSVLVNTFSIGKYEVTQADWREVMGEDPPDLANKGCNECPVERVSWDKVQAFIKTLNKGTISGKKYRLPTEEEWEYAARGGNKSKGYIYSGNNDLKKVGWYKGNSNSKTHRVGDLTANELGIFDMTGNVYEWCQDYYKPYPGCKAINEGTLKVTRGGAWYFSEAIQCRIASRGGTLPDKSVDLVGFRLAQ